jgi:DNA-binding NarL/FixJ family response regulator
MLDALPYYLYFGSIQYRLVFLTRILIADDRELMRSALKAIFALRSHWQVCGEATDGAEAVAMALQLQPDLIILDFKMPLGDGIRAASQIMMAMPSIPIVMYTLYKTEELESAAKLVGIRAVVGKEDGVRSLLSAVDAELAAKQ